MPRPRAKSRPLRAAAALLLLLGLTGAPPTRAADHTTLLGQHVVGYQGWFGCPGDAAGAGWAHWFRGNQASLGALTVDVWPDVSELDARERCATPLRLASGAMAPVFSSANRETVRRHFRWMRDYGIDGAAVQRFVTEVAGGAADARPNIVLRHARAAAEAEGRGFYVMYDLSGAPGGTIVDAIETDWLRLARNQRITGSAAYMHHHGQPVVALWGLGFTHVEASAQDARDLQEFFGAQGVTLIGGVPAQWRTRDGDSRTDPAWEDAYRGFSVLSPWTVGRFATPDEAATFARRVIAPDLAATRQVGQDYLPVIFPGFSWHNLQRGVTPIDQIPRRCGAFYTTQAQNALSAGARMLYTAMFDEVDEGTAIFKVERRRDRLPEGVAMLAPDANEPCDTASDLYLRLAGGITRAVRARVTP